MQNIAIAIQKHRLLCLLLPSVEAAGMTLSPDRYIRLQRLWQMLPDDCPIDKLQNLLCPVFATDERQQEAFIYAFERIVLHELVLPEPIPQLDFTEEETEKEVAPPSANQIEEHKPDDTTRPPISKAADTPKAATKRRSLVVELDRCTELPYTWNIVPKDTETEINIGSEFNKTILQLRRRELADHNAIDLTATIKATVALGGLTSIRYIRRTRPPEYLLLVERFSRNDHRAGLFDYVFKTLKANDVFAERFFYDSDPRINRNERYPAGLNLHELRNRYPDARLVILGSGYRLLSARTGKLAQWASPLLMWRVRALLTPVSQLEWGYQERQLDKEFLLLPASVESLQYIAESPDTSDVQYEALPDYIREVAETEPIILQEPIMRSLRQYFDSDMLCWISACAIYPALHFELTLQLGKVLSKSFEYNLVTAPNLLTLSRLSWFISGSIPVPARRDMMKYLEQRHPERRMSVLIYLRELMEDKDNWPTNENSVAYAEHRVNLAIMKAMTGEKPDAEMVEELRAVVKRLDRDAAWGDFVLPEVLEDILGDMIDEIPSIPADKAEDGSQKVFEAQLIILGEPGVGKTILVRKLFDKNALLPGAEEATQAIEQRIYHFSGNNAEDYRVTVTDISGQAIYDSTNQLLYKKNALYLLVYRDIRNNSTLEKWLESVKSFGGSSTVILVQNRTMGRLHDFLPFKELQTRFPFLVEYFAIDLNADIEILEQLTFSIQKHIQELPFVEYTIPNSWGIIRRHLEQKGEEMTYISWEEYLMVCKDNGVIDNKNAADLAVYLNNLGSISYYGSNHVLKNIVILQPQKVIDTIYGIIGNDAIQSNNGRFQLKDLAQILVGQEWAGMVLEFIELMRSFELCFPLANQETYIIPKLLPINPPQGHIWQTTDSLQLELHYSFLPEGLFNRFLVLVYLEIKNNLIWRDGVVLEGHEALAEIRHFYAERKISIRLHGKNCKEFLQGIQRVFDGLHANYANLKIEKFVPCKCTECIKDKSVYLFDYEELIKKEEQNIRTVQCKKTLEDVDIQLLINNITLSKTDSTIPQKPLRAFISYSKKDAEYVNELKKHLAGLVRSGKISLLDDGQVPPGENWDEAIKVAIESADIIFVMISAEFLADEDAHDLETVKAKIIPIILSPCFWKNSIFGLFSALPQNDEAIKTAKNRDKIWLEIVNDISRIISDEHSKTEDVIDVSHEASSERGKEEKHNDRFNTLEIGQVLRGTVNNITDFGAFIAIGGAHGLLHNKDVSWERNRTSRDVLNIGQRINVIILNIEDDGKDRRISLGLKQLLPHPWEQLPSEVVEGAIVKGKVVNIQDYGAFIEIQPGVEGLIHISEISWGKQNVNAKEFFKMSKNVEARVVSIDRTDHKMLLSIKKLIADPWSDIETRFPAGTRFKGSVKNITNYGIFVELQDGIGGMVHISDISWTKRFAHPSEFSKVGEELEVIILNVDKDKRQISLGHKQLFENPWNNFEATFPVGSYHEAIMQKHDKKGAIFQMPMGLDAFAPSKHIRKEDNQVVEPGEVVTVKVIEFNKDERRILVSHTRYLEDLKAGKTFTD